jgi:hypothetical protein
VIDIEPPSRIVFSYGYASGQPIPPGGSRVTIQLDGHPAGTLLRLRHEFTDAGVRDQHVQGWRYQLSVFANGVANRVNSAAADTVDRWFAAWSDPDAGSRERALGAVAARGITVHDRFSCIEGDEDLRAHLAAVHRFMPGLRLERRGEIRHCQWRVLADWAAVGADGQEKGRGTNVFVLDADGRIADIAGFWT